MWVIDSRSAHQGYGQPCSTDHEYLLQSTSLLALKQLEGITYFVFAGFEFLQPSALSSFETLWKPSSSFEPNLVMVTWFAEILVGASIG